MKNYRLLLDKEIATMVVYGCSAEDWKKVEVAEHFKPDYISNVHFSGNVKLGVFEKTYELPGGMKKHAGLFNCNIHNCTIADNVYINKIDNYIANYEIGEDTYIENVEAIYIDGVTSFGNGIRIKTLNENGGRELPIFDNMSAPLAYMLTLYHYRSAFIEKMHGIITAYASGQQSRTGKIGKNVRILNGGTIKNTKIGNSARLNGFNRLENGSINSNEKAPALIGEGVICKDFIVSTGSEIKDNVILTQCFVGQGSLIERQYSASDTLIFSNCHLMHGEAVSVFAGPYTVSHHKSTLLIASMVSFINCGSGTNQSNHMYKSGPVHQGILERGCKTSSNSYMMFPARVGAYSLIMGSHKTHTDSSDLPFSYLIENNGESYLVPAVNLRSFGTVRDADKWAKRDKRTDSKQLDPINFNLLNPYTVQQIIKGIEILRSLQKSEPLDGLYTYQNCKIKSSSVQKGIKLYEHAILKYLGDCLLTKLENHPYQNFEELYETLVQTAESGKEWSDMAGLIAPKIEIDKLIDEIEKGGFSLEQIQQKLQNIHTDYKKYEWNWVAKKTEEYLNKSLSEISSADLTDFLNRWENSVNEWEKLIYEDGEKEFESIFRVSYGMDGNDSDREKDFKNVRGEYNDNEFIAAYKKHSEAQRKLKETILSQIKTLS